MTEERYHYRYVPGKYAPPGHGVLIFDRDSNYGFWFWINADQSMLYAPRLINVDEIDEIFVESVTRQLTGEMECSIFERIEPTSTDECLTKEN